MLLQSPALSSPPRSVQVAQPWGRGVGQQSLIFSSLTNLKLFFFFFWNLEVFTWAGLASPLFPDASESS